MGFSAKQVHALRRKLDHRHVRTREANGRELSYIEGWYAISEANRIFGFDGWSRETLESRCVITRENRGHFLAVYLARVRLTVQANGTTLIREGHGTGEGRGASPGEVHDIALKTAETDATKRALATFGRPFGLELYRSGKAVVPADPLPLPAKAVVGAPRLGFHPDDTTPIPRPSRYYGRRQNPLTQDFRVQKLANQTAETPPLVPAAPVSGSPQIDKSVLMLAEPKRLRDKAHLKFVATQPCLICGRQPSDPHHLRFAQPRAMGVKVSDEFTVPLCRGHHQQLHQVGNEEAWWAERNINPLEIARMLWQATRLESVDSNAAPNDKKQEIAQQSDSHERSDAGPSDPNQATGVGYIIVGTATPPEQDAARPPNPFVPDPSR